MAIGDSLKLYWLYVKLSVRAQLQYRAAFLLAALGQFLVTGIEFLGVWAFFERFGRLQRWSSPSFMAWSIVPSPVLMPFPGALISSAHCTLRLAILIGCYSVRAALSYS